MEYTIQKLAKMAGISTRTLRFYDEIGLLKPARINSSGYRIYGQNEVDALLQILLLREMDLDLKSIAAITLSPSFDRLTALRSHLNQLMDRRKRLDILIANVENNIRHEEGEITMTDAERFAGLKANMIAENEKRYGEEIRNKYGDEAVEASNQRMLNMRKEDLEAMQTLEQDIRDALEKAVAQKLPAGSEEGRQITLLHKRWLGHTWKQYSAVAHKSLADMYLSDERFTQHYDSQTPGCAKFLRDAICHWADLLE